MNDDAQIEQLAEDLAIMPAQRPDLARVVKRTAASGASSVAAVCESIRRVHGAVPLGHHVLCVFGKSFDLAVQRELKRAT